MDSADMQALVNSGMAWRLEGSVGRACMAALKAGYIMCGTEAKRDYWGNVVPSRYDLQAGTFGTFDFVAEAMGMDHAQAMADIGDEISADMFTD